MIRICDRNATCDKGRDAWLPCEMPAPPRAQKSPQSTSSSSSKRRTGDRGGECPRCAVPGPARSAPAVALVPAVSRAPSTRRLSVDSESYVVEARVGTRAEISGDHFGAALAPPRKPHRRAQAEAYRSSCNASTMSGPVMCQPLRLGSKRSMQRKYNTNTVYIEYRQSLTLNCSASDSLRTRECLASPVACKDTLRVAT